MPAAADVSRLQLLDLTANRLKALDDRVSSLPGKSNRL